MAKLELREKPNTKRAFCIDVPINRAFGWREFGGIGILSIAMVEVDASILIWQRPCIYDIAFSASCPELFPAISMNLMKLWPTGTAAVVMVVS
jgi:hypothetical protein